MRCITFISLLALLVLGGCSTPDFLSIQTPPPPQGLSVSELLEYAEKTSEAADTKAQVLQGIRAFEQVLQVEPDNYRALVMAANQYILLGAAYETGRSGKKAAFGKALELTERAMRTNPEFDRLRGQGQNISEAVLVLSAEQMAAMVFWATAEFYRFDEVLYKFQKLPQHGRLRHARKALEHAYSIDPDWEGGTLHVSWGIYYLAVPSAIGGSPEKSAAAFEKAIRAGPDRLLPRWSRARYAAVKYRNWDQFHSDLAWVVSQKPEQVSDHGAWAAFIQRDARRLLEKYKNKR